ncbi:MAG: hypothetical protein ACE5Z5_08955 [Candidatus Bathyarchaeia archaeon]
MHGFILLLSSVAHWKKDQSISNEILTRLDKIETIFGEVSSQTPDWGKIGRLLEGFPSPEEHLESLMQDGEMLRQQPSRWERERRETTALLAFMRIVFNFLVRKHPELRPEFDRYIRERMDRESSSIGKSS